MSTSSTALPKPIVVAFATAKGGMGKTTLSVIVASYMHYKMGIKAAILDVDGSQLSVYNQRLREAENLGEEGQARLMERQEKEGIEAYQILSGYPGDVPKLLKHLPDGTQLVFVDLPGNIEIAGYDLALKEVDLLIVPMETSEYSVTTGFQYLSAIKQIGLLPLTNCWIVWNKYKPSRDGAQADQLEEVFQSHGFQCLKSRIPQRDSYQDPANRSTLFAMPAPYLRNSGLKDLFSELEGIFQKITQNK